METKASVFDKYNGPLRVGTLQLAPLKPNQILVKVYAAALNPVDTVRRKGRFSMFVKDTFPSGNGFDFAGVVDKIGSSVTRFVVGDRVCGCADLTSLATVAEYCNIYEADATKLPSNVTFNEGAAMPLVGLTAYQALIESGLKEGDEVFIAGGSGGVGSCGVQIAKHLIKAKRVVATCSTSKVDACKSLGADEVIDYKKVDPYSTATGQFDAMIDYCGEARRMGGKFIKPGKKIVSVAALPEPTAFDRAKIPIPFFVRGFLYLGSLPIKWSVSPGIYKWVFATTVTEQLDTLAKAMGEGKLKVPIDTVFIGLEKTEEAFERMNSKKANGKIVIQIRAE